MRDRTSFLINRLNFSSHKPLIIRGARQVGKTRLIRDFAHSQNLCLIELNFEKRPEFESLFSSNHPQDILIHISTATGNKIEPLKSLLFL